MASSSLSSPSSAAHSSILHVDVGDQPARAHLSSSLTWPSSRPVNAVSLRTTSGDLR